MPRCLSQSLFRSTVAIASLVVAMADGLSADGTAEPGEFSAEQIEFFEMKVRPVLAESCYDCHTGRKARNGLQLDSRAGWLKGSDYRKVVNPEKPAESVAILAVKHAGGAAKIKNMPEKGEPLSAEAIADLEKWIGMGLPWPAGVDTLSEERSKGANHWAFQPVTEPPIAEAFEGHPIDYFLDRKLTEAGLSAAPGADRATLYRRAYFGLLGLPPKFEEQQAFASDPKLHSEVWAATIDRLLESPHFGERQARHWMDLARYSDTKGYEAGGRERRFIYSHTYRDWLIRSFNEDLPYDQFVRYQLAADQLVDQEKPAERGHLAAMGFLTLSKNGGSDEVFADRIDTTFRGLQALTVGCARCHDHKSDPIGTEEYYGLYGVFLNSVNPPELPVIGEPKSGPEYEAYLEKLAEKQKVVDDFLDPKLAVIAKKHPDFANQRDQLMRKLERVDRRKLQDLQRVVDKFVADSQMEPDQALILVDREKPIDQPVFIRGSASRRGEIAPRKFLDAVSGGEAPAFQKGSGRLELADAIADPANPLTARVIVNRTWAQHFGEGLVRTVSDFGTEGEKPTHPELLDWLSSWFVENGWSLKKLHRLILTSEAWQRASVHPESKKADATFAVVDPENRLLWRQNRQRLDFEQMHDALLNVAGNLSDELYGPSVKLLKEPFTHRRAVYAFIDRQNVDPTFRIFDFSNPQEHTGKRPRTSIPMQALFMMNGSFVQAQTRQLLNRPEVKAAESPEAKIGALYRAVFARDPSEQERQRALSFLQQVDQSFASLGARQTLSEWEYGFGGVDPETEEVNFRPLEHWSGEQWQATPEYPVKGDPRSYLRFRQDGHSHAGSNLQHAAIVRWTAPAKMTVAVDGRILRHESVIGKGDGLTSRLVVSGQGSVLQHVIPPATAEQSMAKSGIEVNAGDTIDFVTEPNAHASFDSFQWQPEIRAEDDSGRSWNFSAQFSGPVDLADAWETYAQALLGTNEFLFAD